MVKRDAVSRPLRLEAVEERERLGCERAPVVARRERGVAVELVEVDRPDDREIVVPGEADVGALLDERAALVRSRPVSNEIADSLEVTLATVKWRIWKAREDVQLALAREGIEVVEPTVPVVEDVPPVAVASGSPVAILPPPYLPVPA